jgi:hypothetical protein
MILRMAPEQIANLWDNIRPGIMQTMVPVADQKHESIQRVLRSLLAEDMQLWLGLENPDVVDDTSVYGVMVTTIYADLISDTKSLLIYSLFETRPMPPAIWAVGLRKLKEFAAMTHCTNIIAYTDDPRIVQLTQSMGFKAMTFLRKEL